MFGVSRGRVVVSLVLTSLVGGVVLTVLLLHEPGAIYRNDGTVYFLYTRSLVVDLDLDFTNDYELLDRRYPPGAEEVDVMRLTAQRQLRSGRVVFPWPYGIAALMAPPYALGYGVELAAAAVAGRAPDSFGAIPQLFFGFGVLAWGLLGFWTTFLLCRDVAAERGAGEAPAWIATLAVLFGSSVVFYAFLHPTMAHAPSFGVVALLVWLWWRRWRGADVSPVLLGALVGVLVTVRYQHVLYALLLLPLFVREARRDRRTALRQWTVLAAAALVPVALLAVHLAATVEPAVAANEWHLGGEGVTLGQNEIDPRSPYFWQVLFSCQHGAFYWTPVLLVGFLGLLWSARAHAWAATFAAVFLAHVYLVGALAGLRGYNWSGSVAFGMRYLTETAPLLAAGATALLAAAWTARRRVWRGALTALLAALVAGNGLLVLAYGMNEISHLDCVTHREMAAGIGRALRAVFHKAVA